MILLRNLRLGPDESPDALRSRAAKKLGVAPGSVRELRLVRRSLDARHKDDIHYICSVAVALNADEARVLMRAKGADAAPYVEKPYVIPAVKAPSTPPVVVGFGPAGMFAALLLSRAGARPIVLERGAPVEERTAAVERFRAGGPLDGENNVQFGEGGAGTFSDGKLNTGTHDSRIGFVLKTFYEHGAAESVLYDAKPHVGTDVLVGVVRSSRTCWWAWCARSARRFCPWAARSALPAVWMALRSKTACSRRPGYMAPRGRTRCPASV